MELRFPSPSRLSYSSQTQLKTRKLLSRLVLRRLASSSSLSVCASPRTKATLPRSLSAPTGLARVEKRADPTPKELTWRVLSVVETSGLAVVAGVLYFSETISSSSYSSSYSSSRRFVLFLPYLGLQTVGHVGRRRHPSHRRSHCCSRTAKLCSRSAHPPGNLGWIQLTLELIVASRLIVSLAEHSSSSFLFVVVVQIYLNILSSSDF